VSGEPTQVRQIGSDKSHLKIQYQTEENQIDVIAFRFGELFNFITNHSELEVVGELSINEWNGNRTVQIIAEDMAVNEKQIFDYRGKKARTNLQPYIDHYEKIIIVEENNHLSNLPEHVTTCTYDSYEEIQGKIDLLIISDMPKQKSDLFENKLNRITNREDFKNLYGFILKEKSVDMKTKINNVKKIFNWSREQIIFMVLVFIELKLIESNNSVLTINFNSEKKSLE